MRLSNIRDHLSIKFLLTLIRNSAQHYVDYAFAHVQMSIRLTPALFNEFASSLTVAPVVMTSSTIAICCALMGLMIVKAFLMFVWRC